MEFSLSHTRGFVACAVAPVRIGIDVEWLDREVEVKDIVEHHFSASEAASLNRLPAEERRDRFFQLWTLKEAFFKALGCGISGHLDTAAFDLENPITINFKAPNGIHVSDWQFALFLPHPKIRMAIALESAQPVRFIPASGTTG
jgi:4'-phosphopantetheinyl transferase